jgi:hypothetical protein
MTTSRRTVWMTLLGGALCAGLAGAAGGGLFGAALALVRHDLSLTLDGAVVGAALAALAGAALAGRGPRPQPPGRPSDPELIIEVTALHRLPRS